MQLLARIASGVLGALFTLRYGVGLYAWRVSNLLERPRYATLATLPGGVEIRQYEPYVVAEAELRGDAAKGTASGFRACAGYIFGKNRARGGVFAKSSPRPMAMTAPVRMERSASLTKMSFVMAANETRRSLPTPEDATVSLRNVPAHAAAFVKFAGPPPSDEKIEASRARVEIALVDSGYAPVPGAPTLTYGYHDPFATPNVLRRNEVGVFVRRRRGAAGAPL